MLKPARRKGLAALLEDGQARAPAAPELRSGCQEQLSLYFHQANEVPGGTGDVSSGWPRAGSTHGPVGRGPRRFRVS